MVQPFTVMLKTFSYNWFVLIITFFTVLPLKYFGHRLFLANFSTCIYFSLFQLKGKTKGRPVMGFEFGHLVCLWRRPKAAKANILLLPYILLLLLSLAIAPTLMQIVPIVSSQSVCIIKFIFHCIPLSPLYSLLTFTHWCCLFPF